jgi:formylglycine-generating enzyme required for sulfatase activity
VQSQGATLLKKTGESRECASRWGNDAAYDMVGNLDEWVDDPVGKFVGGFYSRATREGCDASVSNHPRNYFDYSLGTRCCK